MLFVLWWSLAELFQLTYFHHTSVLKLTLKHFVVWSQSALQEPYAAMWDLSYVCSVPYFSFQSLDLPSRLRVSARQGVCMHSSYATKQIDLPSPSSSSFQCLPLPSVSPTFSSSSFFFSFNSFFFSFSLLVRILRLNIFCSTTDFP